MGRYALVDSGGVVQQVIEWDGSAQWHPPSGLNLVPGDSCGGVGWTYLGGTFSPPVVVLPPPTPSMVFTGKLSAGLAVSWTVSTALNATYDVDPNSQSEITAEMVSILTDGAFTNGQVTRTWLDFSSTPRTFSVAQFQAFAKAVALYVDALINQYAVLQAGGTPTWPAPTATISM